LNPLLDADGDIGAASGSDTGVDTASAAGEQSQGEQQTGEQQQHEIKDEKDFASALKAREEQIRAKLEQEYTPYKAHASSVERIAKEAGFATVDDYLKAVDDQLRARKAEEEAKRMQVDPETYNQFFAPVHSELQQTKQQLQQLQQAALERQIRAEYDRLKGQYPDFESVQDAVFDLAGKRNLPLEDAYKLVSYDSRIAAAKQEAEQQVLANVTGRDAKQVLPGSDKGSGVTFDPANMSLKDIEEISRRVQRGERISF
jgi:hypothetical protein